MFKTLRDGLSQSFPLQLYHKAKRHFWDPQALALAPDRESFGRLAPGQQQVLLHLSALFVGGEEAVTLDLLPLIAAIAGERRLEEELFLTTFLLDEAKHVEFFSRVIREVAQADGLERFVSPSYQRLFGEALPAAMGRLSHDPSPEAQVEAAVTYNLIVEGVLAETGYYAYRRALELLSAQGHPLPGVLAGIAWVQRDEARHIAYGLYLLSRLIADAPPLWQVAERQLNRLLPEALGVVAELFGAYPEGFPLPLAVEEFTGYALGQFQKRYRKLEQARQGALAELAGELDAEIASGVG